MTISTWQRVDRFGRNLAPGALSIFLLLLSAVPVRLPEFSVTAPILVLGAVFYWTIHRPDLLRPSALFVIGMLQDLVSGGPIGVSSLILVMLHWILLNQRRLFLAGTFGFMWFGFALTVFSALTLRWLVHSALDAAPMPVPPVVFQGLMTLALFPVLAWIFVRVHRTFLSD